MILFWIVVGIVILRFAPGLCFSVGKMITGNSFEQEDHFLPKESKSTFIEHNHYTQNNIQQNLYVTDKNPPDPKSINEGD